MRIRKALISTVVSMTIGIFFTPAAHAQSLFQKLFGFGNAPAAQTQALPPHGQTIPAHRFTRRMYHPRPGDADEPAAAEEEIGPSDSGGPYRTVCVRTCDGFYFPLRANAKRKNFAADVKSCRAACGSEARLFYSPMSSLEGADAFVDLAGRRYSALPHAFAYRKALVAGCACKPVPWSVEATEQHRVYAEQEAIELAKDQAYLAAKAKAKAAEALQQVQAPVPPQSPQSQADVAVSASEPEKSATPETPAASGDSSNVAAVEDKTTDDTIVEDTTPAASSQPDAPPQIEVTVPAEATAPAAEKPVARRRTARLPRAHIQRARFTPTSSGFAGFGKSKYVWPGDR